MSETPLHIQPQILKTPPNLMPGPGLSTLGNDLVPELSFKSNFHKNVKPQWWTLEGYFAHAYIDTDDFVHDMHLLGRSSTRGPDLTLMKNHCRHYYLFCISEEGQEFVRLLKADNVVARQSRITLLEASIAGHRALQDKAATNSDEESVFCSTSSSGEIKGKVADSANTDLEHLLQDIQMKEPWWTLMVACVDKIHGHSVDDLNLPQVELDDVENILVEKILHFLSKPTLSATDCSAMFTALTGIIDLRSDHVEGYSVETPELLAPDESVAQLLLKLKRYLVIGVSYLVLKCDEILGDTARRILEGHERPPETAMVRLIRDLAEAIDQGSEPVSEAEIVALWRKCLETLSQGALKMRSGEFVCHATTSMKKLFTKLLHLVNNTDSGRKVDLLLLVEGMEVLNVEAKALNNTSTCDQQYQKNLRINHAIWVAAQEAGVKLGGMTFLDIRGMTAMICGFMNDGTKFFGGAACRETITVPKTRDELKEFIDGPSAMLLWNYVGLLVKYQDTIRLQIQLQRSLAVTTPPPRTPKHAGGFCTPPRRPKLYRLGEVTALSPNSSSKKPRPLGAPGPPRKPKGKGGRDGTGDEKVLISNPFL
ncbi:hypothetical protein EMPS_09042 [Entomortierella parvispora]|uniref:Uncharacterized protein n=1 Tax=Entomortierella parvispora TaxID=205924 RepID=A0A9P3HHT3_9FUNG|nr:hypothetical protein EMPS_09042 [Entomortierella parvispora]